MRACYWMPGPQLVELLGEDWGCGLDTEAALSHE